jgi:hypothetical protein
MAISLLLELVAGSAFAGAAFAGAAFAGTAFAGTAFAGTVECSVEPMTCGPEFIWPECSTCALIALL